MRPNHKFCLEMIKRRLSQFFLELGTIYEKNAVLPLLAPLKLFDTSLRSFTRLYRKLLVQRKQKKRLSPKFCLII
jgi:hypothetical protein